MEIGLKRKADTDELFPDEHEIKRRFAESSKNWNDLPVEMKMACIQWMDFETRCNLWQTSRNEQPLVENKRFPIICLEIRVAVERGTTVLKYTVFRSRMGYMKKIQLPATRKELLELEMAFRLGAIRTVDIRGSSSISSDKYNPFALFSPGVVFVIDKLRLRGITKFALPILHQCKTLKSIDFSRERSIAMHVFSIPSVFNTPLVEFHVSDARTQFKTQSQWPIRLVQKWIENDCQIGQKLEVEGSEKNVYEIFLKTFENRIIHKTEEEVRISTDNDEKHIFLKGNFGKSEPLACSIVPFDLNDPDVLD